MYQTGNELTAHAVTAAAIVYLIQWAKRSRWFPFMSATTKRVNIVASMVLAAAATLGIGWTYAPETGTLTITGLTLSAIALSAYEWLKQFLAQQLFWDGFIDKKRR